MYSGALSQTLKGQRWERSDGSLLIDRLFISQSSFDNGK